jgi:hypothetical protein
MSARIKIYIKHNLNDGQIKNINKIILEKYMPKVDSYFEYIQSYDKIIEKQDAKCENRVEKIITLEQIKEENSYQKIDSVYARVAPYNLTMEELEDPLVNLYGFDFDGWILNVLNSNRLVELEVYLFRLLLSKSVIEVDCFTIGFCLYSIEKYREMYINMRRFVYNLVEIFDTSKDYRALYINDEGIQEGIYEDIIEGFEEKNKSFEELYNKSLNYFHIDAVNPPTEEEWLSSGNRRDKDGDIIVCPIVIDDFRDFKELENT